LSDYKILVAEDNATHQVLLNYILKNELKIENVKYANDGQETYQMLQEALKKETPFDCCILDYSMPIINGIEVIKWY
jgi:CheY-like chemotaxis protein